MTYNYEDNRELDARTFVIVDGPAGKTITCLVCGTSSNSTGDIDSKRCGRCSSYHPVRIKNTDVCDAFFRSKDMTTMSPTDIREVRMRATVAGRKDLIDKCNRALSKIWRES